MVALPRRAMLKLGMAGLGMGLFPSRTLAQTKARIAIIGGGFGGATTARRLKALLPTAHITLIEANPVFTSCPFSNLVISGDRDLAQQQFSYDALAALGIDLITTTARDIDPVAKTVECEPGRIIEYDKLILSPGIDLRWNVIEGYNESSAEMMPHAWKAGHQTTLLRARLEAIEDGQLVLMSVPTAPYRCPPGPYERASLIAHYLKTQKPRSKLIVLDGKDQFSKMALFQEAWAEHYPDHLEWRGAVDDGTVSRVDASSNAVFTDFETFQSPAVNIIPPQKAALIADRAGVTDATGWCPIDPLTFASTLQSDIHVIGDATIAAPMPKSAFSANLQGKVCATAIASELAGIEVSPTILANTCYSYTTPKAAISIAGVYGNKGGQLRSISGAGGVSPLGADKAIRRAEAAQASHWFDTITTEAFG
ncbi:MAG: FCSD flavin-binding domain-containing protein [Pseudomonadota bacterium]